MKPGHYATVALLSLLAFVAPACLLNLSASDRPVEFHDDAMPATLNPLFAVNIRDYRAQELVFDRLYFDMPHSDGMQSRIVASDEVVDKTLKLTLREGISWHDGAPLTADDLCFTVRAMLDPATPVSLPGITGCTVLDSLSATLAFDRPGALRERATFAVVPAHSEAMDPNSAFATHPIGTGSYTAERTPRDVTFSAASNPHRSPQIRALRLREGGDPFVSIHSPGYPHVHGLLHLLPAFVPEVGARNYALHQSDGHTLYFVALNTHSPVLSDVRIRKALHLALDRSDLLELTVGIDARDRSPAVRANSGPFVLGSPYYNRDVPLQHTSDLAQARALLLEAGLALQNNRWTLNGNPIVLRIAMAADVDRGAADLLTQIGNQIQALGLDVHVELTPHANWRSHVLAGEAIDDLDLAIGTWTPGPRADLMPLVHTRTADRGRLNIFNYSDATTDRLLQRHKDGTDTAGRDAYRELHSHLAQDHPYLFLWQENATSAWRDDVRGVSTTPYFYFTDIDRWHLD